MQVKFLFAVAIPAISAASLPVHDYVEARSPVSHGKLTKTGKQPFVVAIEKDGIVRCGGALIDPTAVLTARSCVKSLGDKITVHAGTTVFESPGKLLGGKTVRVSKIHSHPVFDAAILTLDQDITTSITLSKTKGKTKPVKLAAEVNTAVYDTPGLPVTAFGWGYTSEPENPTKNPAIKPISATQLMEIPMIVQHDSECERALNQRLDNEHFCLKGASAGQGMCHGDVGSPVIDPYNGRLVGISIGTSPSCGNGNKPDLFLDVRFLEPYIRANVPGLADVLWKWGSRRRW